MPEVHTCLPDQATDKPPVVLVHGASAETDCTLLALNRQVFLNLVKAGPEFAASLLAAVAERVRAVAGRA